MRVLAIVVNRDVNQLVEFLADVSMIGWALVIASTIISVIASLRYRNQQKGKGEGTKSTYTYL